MPTKTVDISELANRPSEVLSQAAGGTEIIVTERDVPRAKLVPLTPSNGDRIPGLHPGAMQMSDDFDASLPDEFWLGTP